MKLEIDIDGDYYKIICKRVEKNKPYHSPYEYEVIADGKSIEQEPIKPMVEIDLDYVIKQKYIEREVLDKILKEIADLKAKDVMKELNRERTAAFEWTKHDIYRIVEKAKAEEGEK